MSQFKWRKVRIGNQTVTEGSATAFIIAILARDPNHEFTESEKQTIATLRTKPATIVKVNALIEQNRRRVKGKAKPHLVP